MESINKWKSNFFRIICLSVVLGVLGACAVQGPTIPSTSADKDFVIVETKSSDSLKSLAQQYLNDANLWWRIADFNGIEQLSPGTTIAIPLENPYPGGLYSSGEQTVPVLTYHQISDGKKTRMTVTQTDFERQLVYLQENNYRVISIEQLYDFLQAGEVPKKSVVITIDDGWRTAYDVAYPLLKKFNYPATLFLTVGLIDKSSKLVTWDMVREMYESGLISMQAHTRSHRDLTKRNDNESFERYFNAVVDELSYTREIIGEKTGKAPNFLAYPYGKTNQLIVDIAKSLGYKAAFTVKRGGNASFVNDFRVGRSMIFGTYNMGEFVKNLETFERNRNQTSNPSAATIDLSQVSSASATALEQSKFWREALIHWQLVAEKSNNTADVILAKDKIKALSAKLNNESETLSAQGGRNIAGKNLKTAKRVFKQAVLANPNNQQALRQLKNVQGNESHFELTLDADDTPESIASRVYKQKNKAIIPQYFASDGSGGGWKAGNFVRLPLFDDSPVKETVVTTASSSKTTADKNCGLTNVSDRRTMAISYYQKGNARFDNDDIDGARKALETAVCLDSEYTQAQNLLDLLREI